MTGLTNPKPVATNGPAEDSVREMSLLFDTADCSHLLELYANVVDLLTRFRPLHSLFGYCKVFFFRSKFSLQRRGAEKSLKIS